MNWRKILAVTTAMAAIGAFVPSSVVQKCASMVFAVEESVVTVQPEFTYDTIFDYSEEITNDDGTTEWITHYCLSITGFSDSAAGDIVIPEEINEYKVKSISYYFQNSDFSKIRSITIPKTLETGIENIPKNIKIIIAEGNESYYQGNGIIFAREKGGSYETQPDGTQEYVKRYYANAIGFDGTAVGDVVIPDKIAGLVVERIDWGFAYADFSGVKSITIPKTINNESSYLISLIPVDIKIEKGNESYSIIDGIVYGKKTRDETVEKADGTQEMVTIKYSVALHVNSDAPESVVIPEDIDGYKFTTFESTIKLNNVKKFTLPKTTDYIDYLPRYVDLVFSADSEKYKNKDGFIYTEEQGLITVEKKESDGGTTKETVQGTVIKVIAFDDSLNGDIIIPNEIDGKQVRSLDIYGSEWKERITSITLPSYLKNLGNFDIPSSCTLKTHDDSEYFIVYGDFLLNVKGDYVYNESTGQYDPVTSIVKAVRPISGEVYIPDGIGSVGTLFRGNSDITVINIPASVVYMSKYFCENMPSLTAINVSEKNPVYFSVNGALGKKYTYIPYKWDEDLSDFIEADPITYKNLLAVPEGFEGEFTVDDNENVTICGLAFENCKKVTSVKLGKGTDFRNDFKGFIGCDSLENIEMNCNISYFEKSWIDSTPWYKSLSDGAIYSGTMALGYKGDDNTAAEVTFKDGTTQLPWFFFTDGKIDSMNIPSSVELIGEYVLDQKSISAVNVDPENKVYASEDGVLFSKDMKTLKFYPQSKTDETYSIPEGTELIAALAFEGNQFIKHINIPESVEIIYGTGWGGAFRNCKSLEEIKVPSKVRDMDWGELDGCNLKVLDLPETMPCYTGHFKSVPFSEGLDVIKYTYFGCLAKYERIVFRNADCDITDVKDAIIVGYKGSTAEKYAADNNLTFELLDDYDAAQATATTTTTTTNTNTTTQSTTTTSTTTATTTSSEITTSSVTTTTTNSVASTTSLKQSTTTTSSEATTATNASTTTQSTTEQTTTSTTTSEPSVTTVDSRLVGTWTETEAILSNVGGPMTYDFKDDGTGSFRWKDDPSNFFVPITWYTEEETLYIKEEVEDGSINTYNFSFKDGTLVLKSTNGKDLTSELNKESVPLGDPTGDGKIDANDASFMLVEYAKMSTGSQSSLSPELFEAADINKDGKVDSKDASIVLSYYSYLSTGGKDKIDVFIQNQIG